MTNDGASSLTFSMKEEVWLERGKEMDELLSLSLEPDIEVFEEDDTVSVQGVLHLTGEFRGGSGDRKNEGEPVSEKDMAFRSAEDLSDSDAHTGTFHHQLPLDISIPKDRVEDQESLGVTIQAFDYAIPERGCLEVSADLSVTGVRGEAEYDETVENGDLKNRTFAFEQMTESSTGHQEQESSNDEGHYHEAQQEEPHNESPLYTIKAGGPENGNSYDSSDDTENDYRDEAAEFYENDMYDQDDEGEAFENTGDETGERDSEEDGDRDEAEESKTDNALYLTKMLAGEEEEEGYSKLRMCIVQNGESLDTIADRYSLQVSQLMRLNRLNDEQVSEGQILYIPAKPSSSSR